MQLTICVVTGFLALSAASPARPIVKQIPSKSSAKATPAQSTGISTSRNVSQMKGGCIPCGDNSDTCQSCHFQCDDCEHLVCTPPAVASANSVNFCVDLRALPLHTVKSANGTAAASKGTVASLFFRTIEGFYDQPRGYGDDYQGPPEPYYDTPCSPEAPCPPEPPTSYDGPPCSPDAPCPPGPPEVYNGPPEVYNGPPEVYNGPPEVYNGPPEVYNGPPCPPGVSCPPVPSGSYNGPPCPPGVPCPPGPPEPYSAPPCPPGASCPPGPPGPPGPPNSYDTPLCPPGDSCPPGPPETYTGPPCPPGAPCPLVPYHPSPKRGHYNGSAYGYHGQSYGGRPYNGGPYHRGPSTLPPISNGAVPYFEFNEEDCMACTDQNPCTGNCTWQFDCSNRFTCFYNNAHEVVELCYEQRQNCP